MKKNYKSILGLDTVKAFIVVMLSLAIIGIVVLVVMGALLNANLPNTERTFITNQSTGYIMNSTTSYTASTNIDCLLSLVTVTSDNMTAVSSNSYTVSGCTVTPLSSATIPINNTVWYLSGTYTDSQNVASITSNVSKGINGFFGNAVTFFSLLGVVVIILIISLVVVVVNRFGGSAEGGQENTL
jgi:hypothetical protein